MNLWTLSREVKIEGPNYWGRPSAICLTPADHREMKWTHSAGQPAVPLRPGLCSCLYRRLSLKEGCDTLEIAEHILPLRLDGLVGVDIVSSRWPPYSGRTEELLHAAQACRQELNEMPCWYGVARPARWTYRNLRGGRQAFTEIYPASSERLDIEVIVNFPGLGEKIMEFSLPDPEMLRHICRARTPGWPPHLYWLSKAASFIPGLKWQHDKISWPQGRDPKDVLEESLWHRAQDLLGMLAFLCCDGMLAGRVVSCCSGHEADWHVLNEAFPLLRRLDR